MEQIRTVSTDYIIDRFKNDYDFESSSYNIPTLIEWIGNALLTLPLNKVLETRVTDNVMEPCINIDNYKGLLPCNLINVIHVRDYDTGIVFEATSNLFLRQDKSENFNNSEYTVSGDYIYTNVEDCNLEIIYTRIKLDEDNKPLIPDIEDVVNYVVRFLAKNIARKLSIRNLLSERWYIRLENQSHMAHMRARGAISAICIDEAENIGNEWNRLTRSRFHRKNSFRNLGKYPNNG